MGTQRRGEALPSSKEMSLEEEFLEPLGEAVFSSLVPQEGFRLIFAGELLERLPSFGFNMVQMGLRTSLPLPGYGYVVLPFNMEGHGLEEALKEVEGKKIPLLCPVDELVRVQCGFFDVSDTPLFQKFANLGSEEEVLAFANKYGSLHSKMSILQSLSPKSGVVYLESVRDWAYEINLVRTALKLIEVYENRSWDSDLKVIAAGKFGASYNIEGTSFCVDGPPPPKAGMDENVFKLLLVRFFNARLREHQSSLGYGFDDAGRFISAIYPTTLEAAIWLQLAQSFFGDAPSERMAKRCFVCGCFGSKANMRKRFKGEHRGGYYHIGCYETLKRRKQREKKAGMEGRSPKERQKKQFLVDSL